MKKTYIILWLILSLVLTWCWIDWIIIKENSKDVKTTQQEESVKEENKKRQYENKSENFSFEFLSWWNFEENKYGFNTIVFSPKDDEIKENVWISVQQLQKFLSVAEYYEETINNLEKTIKTFEEVENKNIEIWNLKWKKIIYEYKEWEITIKSQETFLISKENKVYIINYTATKDTFEKFLEWSEIILNSFKITK